MSIRIKRIYEAPARGDGRRVLVDRVWPRGIKKDEAKLDDWLKDVAPSTPLRKWFGHDPDKWPEFRTRYRKELDAQSEAVGLLAGYARKGTLTLLYGARDEQHNQAVVLRDYLQKKTA
ncbi:MAG TPA: DUF488 domain-containing protein [Gammaproteobacteria bacterium]|nr:DUF488 domain-containing protein [Gammaproteobacteria bacterium]